MEFLEKHPSEISSQSSGTNGNSKRTKFKLDPKHGKEYNDIDLGEELLDQIIGEKSHFRQIELKLLRNLLKLFRNFGKRVSQWPSYWRSTLRSDTIFGRWKSFKNNEKCFLFHLKSSFLSQYIYFFVLTFSSYKKTAWLER